MHGQNGGVLIGNGQIGGPTGQPVIVGNVWNVGNVGNVGNVATVENVAPGFNVMYGNLVVLTGNFSWQKNCKCPNKSGYKYIFLQNSNSNIFFLNDQPLYLRIKLWMTFLTMRRTLTIS